MEAKNKKAKIEQIRKLVAGEDPQGYKGFVIIEEDGKIRCDDPDYPDKVRPQDIVFHVIVVKTANEGHE